MAGGAEYLVRVVVSIYIVSGGRQRSALGHCGWHEHIPNPTSRAPLRAAEDVPCPERRRVLLGAIAFAGMMAFGRSAAADKPSCPVSVQAQILARILPFERGFTKRVKDRVVVVLVEKPDDPDSTGAVGGMQRALQDAGTIAGKPIRMHTTKWAGPGALASSCRSQGAHAVYIAPGLAEHVSAIARELGNTPILSFAAVERDVAKGIVLGVELRSGKPNMSINLKQAKRQALDFPSAVLKLAKIY